MAYINPKGDGKWFKFDDDVVACCNTKEAILSNFGGTDEKNGFVKSCTNAYMLVYIRKSQLPCIIFGKGRQQMIESNVNNSLVTFLKELSEKTDIPVHLATKFTEEREIEAIKRKEKNEAHYFMTVNIISDEQFGGHQGSGLIDPDCISFRFVDMAYLGINKFRTIKARKDLSWAKLKVKLADYLGCDEETFRIWFFKRKYIRSNNADHETWRPEFIDEDDMEKYVSQVSIDYKNVRFVCIHIFDFTIFSNHI